MQGDEFHQTFAFDLMLITWAAKPMRTVITESLDMLASVGGTPAWTLNNHDTQRIVTRLGRLNASDPAAFTGNNLIYVDAPIDLDLGRRRARAAITLTAALPGALYLFQGEEMGLQEYLDMPARRPERTRCSFAPTASSWAAMVAGCRCRGPATRRPTSASRRGRSSRGFLSRPTGASTRPSARQPTRTRCCRGTARCWPIGRCCRATSRGSTSTCRSAWPSSANGALIVANVGGEAFELPGSLVDGRTLILASQPDATTTHVPSDTCVWLSPAH